MSAVIEVRNLVKRFGGLVATDNLSFDLEEGESLGLIGPNGAGKTTMLSIVAGLTRKTSGDIVFGIPRHQMMLMPDTPDFFPLLTAREVVDLARYPFRREVDEQAVPTIIEEVGLADAIDRRVGGFSRGMKQRLGLAATLIGQPQLILLDEPCSALDPIGRREVLDTISRLRETTTVLFSTHILSDVEDVCDSVTVVNEGKALYGGSVNGIKGTTEQSFEDAVLTLLQPERSAQ